jgi:glutamine amidotransferase
LWEGIPDGSRFYFVHSYFAEPAVPGLTAAYSIYPFAFTCAAQRGNIFAVQFHPEKSQSAGLRLLANFTAWEPARIERARMDGDDVPACSGAGNVL